MVKPAERRDIMTHAEMYKDFYFEVVNDKGRLEATFARRWQAEKFAEEYGYTVRKVNLGEDSLKVGDIKELENSQGGCFNVRILKIFVYDGIEYAEVEPADFNGFTREVPTSMLK